MLAPRWVSCGTSAIATTMPTAATLAIALNPSKAIRGPNTFLNPVSGLSLPKLGLIGWKLGLNETWATLTRSPATRHIPAIGATVVSIVCRAIWSSPCSPGRRGGVAGMGDLTEDRAHG